MDQYIEYTEIGLQDNILLIRYTKDLTKTVSKSGIILAVTESKVTDRPNTGICIAQGPDCKKDFLGKQVFFDRNKGYNLENVITNEDEKYMLVTEDSIDFIKVKDNGASSYK